MRTTPSYLNRWMTTAALLGVLGLPLGACAQTAEVAEESAVAEAPVVDAPAGEAPAQEQAAAETAEAAEAADAGDEPATAQESAEDAEAKAIAAELEKLQTEARIRQARLQAELAPLQEEKSRLEAELALANARQQAAQAEQQRQLQQAAFEQQVALAEMTREMEKVQAELKLAQLQAQLDAANQAIKLAEINGKNAELATQTAALTAELTRLQAQKGFNSVDRDEMQYPDQPLKDGVLTISDRRIPLNGAIGGGTADYVTERIHYFNNLNDKAPIFIVIDGSPGGSVMEGYRIVTAMQNSDAPVHVVVKSYAASMAAVITTLAEESYCYPNAIILHHQMSSSLRGNLTQQKEALEEGFEWAKRLADPVAEKMGVDYDRFTELMYENNSDGDWAEFGDVAKELKWVNHVVTNIRETALVTAPGQRPSPQLVYMQAPGDNPETGTALPQPLTQWDLFNSPIEFPTKQDGNGNAYIELPKLQPYDYYFLHDPYSQYRMAK